MNLYLTAGHLLENMNATVDPCDDFFQFACGGWIDRNYIPESSSKWGIFYQLRDEVDHDVKGDFKKPPII